MHDSNISNGEKRRSRQALLIAALMVAGLAGGCGSAGDEAAIGAALEIRDPWVNLVPGGMAAVYSSIVNPGPDGDRLLAVETSAAVAAEIHETVRDGGMMRMVAHPDGFEIPPRGTVELVPGGKHVMLIEPRPSAEGTIRLGFRFEKAGLLELDVPVRSMATTEEEEE